MSLKMENVKIKTGATAKPTCLHFNDEADQDCRLMHQQGKFKVITRPGSLQG